jgi:hypothetical protein
MTDQELRANMKDQFWRLNHLYWIINEQGQRVKFTMNRVQTVLFWGMWFLNIILKSRQHGITTFICLFFLDTCLFNSNIHAGIIAHNREDAEAFFKDKVQYAFNNLPASLRVATPAETESSRELMFPNNSVIRVGTSLRSSTNQLLHISEFGKLCAKYPEKAREVVTGALNTVHQGQMIIIESTAEGRSGYFYDYCKKAMDLAERKADLSELDFKFFFFGWFDDPKNAVKSGHELVATNQDMLVYFSELEKKGVKLTPQQKSWYILKAEQQGDDMKREHPSTPDEAFEAVAASCFFLGALDGHKAQRVGQFGTLVKEPHQKGVYAVNLTPRGLIEFWRFPYFLTSSWDRSRWTYRYCMGSDIGEGLGGDSSVAYVFDRHLREIVARMTSSKIDSHRWGDRLFELSRFFENCLIVPERNGAGITTINRLVDLKANIYVREVVAGIGKQVTKQYGWQETHDAKQSICGTLKAYLAAMDDQGTRKHPVYCKELLQECASFVKDEEKDKIGAEDGFHDDHVIAGALALAGDLYLPKCERIPEPVKGWRGRLAEEAKGKGEAWAA